MTKKHNSQPVTICTFHYMYLYYICGHTLLATVSNDMCQWAAYYRQACPPQNCRTNYRHGTVNSRCYWCAQNGRR